MLDLPLRAEEITVELSRGVQMRLATLTDEQMLEISERSAVEERTDEQGQRVAILRVPRALLLEMLGRQIRALTHDGEPVAVAGEPFDPARAEHVRALPFQWRYTAALELYFYSSALPPDSGKGSMPPAEP